MQMFRHVNIFLVMQLALNHNIIIILECNENILCSYISEINYQIYLPKCNNFSCVIIGLNSKSFCIIIFNQIEFSRNSFECIECNNDNYFTDL